MEIEVGYFLMVKGCGKYGVITNITKNDYGTYIDIKTPLTEVKGINIKDLELDCSLGLAEVYPHKSSNTIKLLYS